MKKPLFFSVASLLLSALLFAQENNPYINSGEIITQAIKLHDEGKYKDAIDLYKKISRSDTNYVYGLYEMALSYSADSQFVPAIHACEMAMAEKTDLDRLPDLLTQYGSLIDNTGNPERALAIFDSALRIYPAHTPLYLNKGTTLLRLKRYKEAEVVFKQNILFDPYAASSHYKLGISVLQNGQVIPAMLCFIHYLWVTPDGRYSNNCISLLSAIANNKPDIQEYVTNRKEEASEEYKLTEQILFSKIALDKNFKPGIELDDAISRQVQVVFEKLEYAEASTDFWIQYYLPAFKRVVAAGQFEPFINYIFSGVNVAQIQAYNKKKKKEVQQMIDETVTYFNKIRSTRVLNFNGRATADTTYYYKNGQLSGKGKISPANKFTGPWIFYYPGGNIKSAGVFNESEAQEGTWSYYHFDGKLKGKQTFINGKLNGEETFFYRNTNPSSAGNYTNDYLQGEGRSYYYAGATNAIAHYADQGKLNGERKRFFSNGSLMTIENYSNDKLNGPFKTWHKSGLQESEGTYLNGQLNGSYKAWHDNGALFIEAQYDKDKPAGTWKRYHENGKLKLTQTFVDGKLDGPYEEYYDNGQLFTKYTYKKGKLDGDISYFAEDGKLYFVYTYDNDKMKGAKYYDKTGKVVSSSEAKGNKIALTTCREDGSRRSTVSYNEKGMTEGTETYYYPSGKPSQVNEYSNGELNGKGVNYFANGQKNVELSYTDGKKNGYYKSYYMHDALESEGWYADDLAEGIWLGYDELGNLTSRSNFLNGELSGYKEEFYPNGKKEYETRYLLGWMIELVQFDTTGKEIHRVNMDKASGRYSGIYFNGKTHFEGNYVQGDFDGPYKFFYYDGSLLSQQFYKHGLIDSTYRTYYYGGSPMTEGQYKNGEKTGTWKYFRKNGSISSSEEYVADKLSGHRIYYFENGKTDLDVIFKDNERNGITKKYDPNGSLAYQVRFQDGLQMGYSYLDKAGQLVPEIPLASGNGSMKAFYSNGTPSAEYEYKDGKVDGPNKVNYSNGKVWSERTDTYDVTSGPIKEYYMDGQLKSLYNYLHDNLHGAYKEYTEKGIVKEEGYYHNGSLHGEVKYYDASGKLTATHYYYYGKLLNVKK